MENLVSIILAAGESKRFKSSKSKIFHEVAGKSMLSYVYSTATKISPKNIIHKVSFKNKKLKNINLGNYYFSDIYSLIKKNNFDYILNFHAHTDIDYANTYPKYDFFHNCSITHSIIEALI